MDDETGVTRPQNAAPPNSASPLDAARRAMVAALGIDSPLISARTRATIDALCEEVLSLREEREALRRQLVDTAHMADNDALVPLFNRRAFLRELRREIALAERFGFSLCLLFLDLDRFKAINDQFGHATGDEVLRRVADILRSHTRDTDVLARLGGDEFGILLAHADLEAGRNKARELMKALSGLRVRAPEPTSLAPFEVGGSCGVAAWQRETTPEMLIAEADAAMYAVKSVRKRSQP